MIYRQYINTRKCFTKQWNTNWLSCRWSSSTFGGKLINSCWRLFSLRFPRWQFPEFLYQISFRNFGIEIFAHNNGITPAQHHFGREMQNGMHKTNVPRWPEVTTDILGLEGPFGHLSTSVLRLPNEMWPVERIASLVSFLVFKIFIFT